MKVSDTIIPRSDQINAEDLITGPMTVTVERVTSGAAEQPIDIHCAETPGRAYRPSKTMRRIIIAAWEDETDVWIGRRMTLYREPTITFGRDEVGGIRISHLSHIDGPLKIALTVKRGQRTPFVVQPLKDEAPQTIPRSTREQQQRLGTLLTEAGIDDKLAYVTEHVGRPITSSKDLDRAEASALIDMLSAGGGES